MKLLFSTLKNKTSLSVQKNIVTPSYESLFRRISPIGDPETCIVPELDQYVREGKQVSKIELQRLIKELKDYKRYKHALEVSYWMTDARYFPLQPSDVSLRIFLMHKVKGTEEVEKYFNSISQQLKGYSIYLALLDCYVKEKSVEKGEAVMQKMRDAGLARRPICYNLMMTLYSQTGDREKMDNLVKEMEQKGINFDECTLTIQLTAYAAAGDSDGMDKIMTAIESDKRLILHWNTYSIAAEMYLKVGQVEKALVMLNKMEGMIVTGEKSNGAFDVLLIQYAKAGKKEEVHRVWDLYKQNEKIYNKGYIRVMRSLMKLDDIEGAEQIFEEWESKEMAYDFRVPNILISAYSRNGHLEKAEALIDRGVSKGGVPWVSTWCHLADGYIRDDQVPKALEALKKAISICPHNHTPSLETLVTCVQYWENQGDVDKAEEFVKSLEERGRVFSAVFRDKLLCFVKDGNLQT